MTKTMTKKCLAMLGAAGSLWAHHSLINYDTSQAVRVKGTVFQFEAINPHSIIFLDEKRPDGPTRRWAIEGPGAFQLSRRAFVPNQREQPKEMLKPGDKIEVCGYLPKEPIVWQLASRDEGASLAGRLFNAETMVMPDGQQVNWGDYGVHKCFGPGYTDQHTR